MANSCKYYKQQKYVSYDSGLTWAPLEVYQKGDLYEQDSSDCGGGTTMYRTLEGTMCDDCANDFKFINTTNVGQTYSVNCNSSTVIALSEVKNRNTIATSTIGSCVTSIGDRAFQDCTNLNSVLIPSTVTSIDYAAFKGCQNLLECAIPDSVTSIGDYAFSGCTQLTYINLPNNLTSLGKYAFAQCLNFSSINIPTTLTYIPQRCFFDCDGLSDIELHSGITEIGSSAFAQCSGLYTVKIFAETPPTLGSNVFGGSINNELKILVPSNAVNTYKTAEGWSEYANKIFSI